ncbi:MAG: hypothetical protein AVDCRST_MAG87-1500 [uncultured Thermomicrobiales bacterium]|uniref:Uncharacterized protein n=1 Tax=uncultured Thermomicrobiales bacterium TaxID=1645740 RepID=A0A6J4UU28_9BACT|nr:MAG: hypothetical protein AVDCRST_MAG87-1500 [uncultured Thermomicrobiales bacterium]
MAVSRSALHGPPSGSVSGENANQAIAKCRKTPVPRLDQP